MYVTGSFAENNGNIIQEIQEHGHDIAFHGWKTGEKLTTMNYSMQQVFTQFLDRIENRNIDVVKTRELLDFFYIEDDEPGKYLKLLWIDIPVKP